MQNYKQQQIYKLMYWKIKAYVVPESSSCPEGDIRGDQLLDQSLWSKIPQSKLPFPKYPSSPSCSDWNEEDEIRVFFHQSANAQVLGIVS